MLISSFLDVGRAYDRAAIKFRGVEADINFNIGDYEDDIKQVGDLRFDLLNLIYDFENDTTY